MRPASLVAWRWLSLEVGRNGDHRLGHCFTEVVFGGFFFSFFFFKISAEICGGDIFWLFTSNPGVTVVSLGDFERDHLDVFLYDFFVEP